MCWVSKLPNKTQKNSGKAFMSRYDITFPEIVQSRNQLGSVIKLSSCSLAQIFNPSGQRGLLKTEKHPEQVEFIGGRVRSRICA